MTRGSTFGDRDGVAAASMMPGVASIRFGEGMRVFTPLMVAGTGRRA